MPRTSRLLAGTAAAALGLAGALATATPAAADHAGDPTIHPGVQTYTEGAQCTANFVFTDGADTFIGQAAHCSGTGAANETDGCLAELAAARHARSRSTARRSPARWSTTPG